MRILMVGVLVILLSACSSMANKKVVVDDNVYECHIYCKVMQED